MRLGAVAFVIGVTGAWALAAQSPAAPVAPPAQAVAMSDVFPATAKIDHFVIAADGRRTYYVDTTGDVWLYDRSLKTNTRVMGGPLWDLSVSPKGDALAFTKAGATRGDHDIWTMALDATTGLASGAERRLSAHADVPSISPDGRLIAFARDDATGVGQSVVLVDTGGGAEHVVATSLPSSIANIRWAPDGKTLYFGVNPPVACVPEWSCLPLAQPLRQPPGTIRRVSASGGDVTIVATARTLLPGLSPDGTSLVYQEATASRRWVVSSPDGSHQEALTLPSTQTPSAWLRGSMLLVSSGGSVQRLRRMSLSTTQAVLVNEISNPVTLANPSWSPNGRLMMVLARGPQNAELRLMNADGSPQRTFPLPENFANAPLWSPDQRWISYTGFGDNGPPRVIALEVATGKFQRLYDVGPDESVTGRWLTDSRGLVLAVTSGRPDAARRVVFRRVDLAGAVTTLREIPLGPLPSGGIAISDTTGLVVPSASEGYRLVGLNGNAADRDVLPGSADGSPAGLSQDGSWLITRRVGAIGPGPQTNAIELVRVDGSEHKTIPVPFIPAAATSARVLPGGNDVIVLETRRPTGDAGVYLVSATSPARKLFTYSGQPPELALSPDGRTLLYLIWETIPPSLVTMDLSAPGRR